MRWRLRCAAGRAQGCSGLRSPLLHPYRFLAACLFTGRLPPEWGAAGGPLASLYELSLSGNRLTGSLPAAWGRPDGFKNLQVLQLDGQADLAGPLPPGWGSPRAFQALTNLSLANNQLSGTIPQSWAYATSFPVRRTHWAL